MSKNVKDLEYYKNNAEGDYRYTPISVLRYITELESAVDKGVDSGMVFHKTSDSLPQPELLNGGDVKYYLVLVGGFSSTLAMYLEDSNGNKGWYTSYTSKIFREVSHWCEIKL